MLARIATIVRARGRATASLVALAMLAACDRDRASEEGPAASANAAPRAISPARANPAPSEAPSSISHAAAAPPNVVIVTVDTLRADHLSLYGYARPTSPHIDAFFERGEVYDRAYSAAASTSPSVVTLLTGLYPLHHGVRWFYRPLRSSVATLPERLHARGFQTAAIVSNAVLTGEAIGLDSRFDYYDDHLPDPVDRRSAAVERRAAGTTDAALEWLAHGRHPDAPFLLWIHYMDPHGPYDPPANRPAAFTHQGRQPIDVNRMQAYQRVAGVDDGLAYVDRYDEEIAYADREIGRLLSYLQSSRLVDDSIVIFAADHGETMLEHERYFTHGYHVWESIMRVPLAVRAPGHEARWIATPVSLVDVVPTLLDALEIELPAELDGTPLGRRADSPAILLEARDHGRRIYGAVSGARKWSIVVEKGGAVQDRWSADLSRKTPAEERRPWRNEGPAALLEQLAARDSARQPVHRPVHVRATSPPESPEQALAPKARAALRALGYVE